MAGGLTLDIGANTREVVRGARDTAEALEEISDALDPLARDGGKVGDKLADGLQEGRREADKLERSFKDLATAAKRESQSAGDDIGRNVTRGTDDAKEGVKEIGREAESTAKETLASFDGSADSIAGMFQEVAANAFAGFGPAGLIAGGAAAVGIGYVTAAFQAAQEEAQRLADKTADVYGQMTEAGVNYVTGDMVRQNILDTYGDQELLNTATQRAKDLGVDVSTVVRAQAGDVAALGEVNKAAGDAIEKANKKAVDSVKLGDETGATRYSNEAERIRRNQASVQGEADVYVNAGKAVRDANEATAASSEARDARQKRADDAASARLQGMADRINGIPTQKNIRVDVDLSAAEAAISAFTRRERAAIQIGATVVGPTGKRVIA